MATVTPKHCSTLSTTHPWTHESHNAAGHQPDLPAFGKKDLATLFITTARHKLAEQQLAPEPLARQVSGLSANRYAD